MRVPFGYRIVEEKAVIHGAEAEQLLLYFRLYLSGMSMSGAAREAKLPCSETTCPHLFRRKEYVGTDFYPALITADYQQKLITEWQTRKMKRPKRRRASTEKRVRIYTRFCFSEKAGEVPSDPVEQIAALYQRIRPQ